MARFFPLESTKHSFIDGCLAALSAGRSVTSALFRNRQMSKCSMYSSQSFCELNCWDAFKGRFTLWIGLPHQTDSTNYSNKLNFIWIHPDQGKPFGSDSKNATKNKHSIHTCRSTGWAASKDEEGKNGFNFRSRKQINICFYDLRAKQEKNCFIHFQQQWL